MIYEKLLFMIQEKLLTFRPLKLVKEVKSKHISSWLWKRIFSNWHSNFVNIFLKATAYFHSSQKFVQRYLTPVFISQSKGIIRKIEVGASLMALYGFSKKAKSSHVLLVSPAGCPSNLVIKFSFREFLYADFVKSKVLPYII